MFGKKSSASLVSKDMEKQRRYEALIRAWHKDLYRYAYWLTKDHHIAEDIVQETCLRAWRSLDSLHDDNAAKAWLITIARRENARRFERKQLDYVDIDEDQIPENEHASDERDVQRQWLHTQIIRLPLEYREPLVLQVLSGFNGDEIAQILDLNKNTVMTRLFRARNKLKELMDKQTSSKRGSKNGRP